MTDTPATAYEVVPALRDHIARRMTELKLDPKGLAAATGLSLTVLGQVRKGYRKQYQRRLTWPLCAALGWTPDSIDRILAGQPPERADITPLDDGAARLQMDEVLRSLGEVLASLQDQVGEIETRLGALERSQSPAGTKRGR